MSVVTLDDIIKTMHEPVSDSPFKTIIDAYFDGTKYMHDFSRDVMIPQLKACGGTDFPAFYSYAYPAPEGFADVQPDAGGAYFDQSLGEFLLPYEVVQDRATRKRSSWPSLKALIEPQQTLAAGIVRLSNVL